MNVRAVLEGLNNSALGSDRDPFSPLGNLTAVGYDPSTSEMRNSRLFP